MVIETNADASCYPDYRDNRAECPTSGALQLGVFSGRRSRGSRDRRQAGCPKNPLRSLRYICLYMYIYIYIIEPHNAADIFHIDVFTPN